MYDIYLDRYLLPLSPEKIQISSKNKNDVVKLINDAEINILKQEGLKEITFDFILPAYNYPFANFRFGYEKQQHFSQMIHLIFSLFHDCIFLPEILDFYSMKIQFLFLYPLKI